MPGVKVWRTRTSAYTTPSINAILHTDGRYQVFILAYNQYGYTRSPGSNVITVGAPSSQPLEVTAHDGDGKISVSFATPEVRAL